MSLRSDHSIAENRHATPVQDTVPVFGLDQYVKCAFDIAAATICLVVLSPILLISAAAIKLESSGPIFTRKTLHDKYNDRAVEAFRFRAVTTCTEDNQFCRQTTHVSQMLTQTGIDELPQLFNVLRGEMSIFGRRNVYRWYLKASCLEPSSPISQPSDSERAAPALTDGDIPTVEDRR